MKRWRKWSTVLFGGMIVYVFAIACTAKPSLPTEAAEWRATQAESGLVSIQTTVQTAAQATTIPRAVQERLNALPVREGELRYATTFHNIYGDEYEVYRDDAYEYSVDTADQSLFSVLLRDSQAVDKRCAARKKKFNKKVAQIVGTERVKAMYPNWDWDQVTVKAGWITEDSERGFMLHFEQKEGDDRINSGHAEFAMDGTLVSCYATEQGDRNRCAPHRL